MRWLRPWLLFLVACSRTVSTPETPARGAAAASSPSHCMPADAFVKLAASPPRNPDEDRTLVRDPSLEREIVLYGRGHGRDLVFAFGPTGTGPKALATPLLLPLRELGRDWPIKEDGKRLLACAGTRCRALGPRVAAEIGPPATFASGSAWADRPFDSVAVTADLTTVVKGQKAYSIVEDRELELEPPAALLEAMKRAHPDNTGAFLARIDVIGNALLPTWEWMNCRTCASALVVDAGGHAQGAPIPAGELLPLWGNGTDDVGADLRGAAVVVGRSGDITVIDTRLAGQLGTVSLKEELVDARAEVLDRATVAVAWRTQAAWRVARIGVSDAGIPTIQATESLPICR